MTEPAQLTFEKQEEINKLKVEQRRGDVEYLRHHPELTLMINRFLRTCLEEAPEDPLTFAGDYFTQKNLEKHILGIDDGGDSSSSGEDVEMPATAEEREQQRHRVQQMMKDKRKAIARRRRRAAMEKPNMELGCDSDTDEEEAEAADDGTYGLDHSRVDQLMQLFRLVDRDGSGTIDSYELSLFAKAFFRTLEDEVQREEAEEMLEEIDINKDGQIDKQEYLSYFSLVVGLMEDSDFKPIYDDLLDSIQGAQEAQEETLTDQIPAERLVKLQMLFQGWDPKNSGSITRDVVFLLARATEKYTGVDATEAAEGVPETVTRKDFIAVCVAIKIHTLSDEDFDAVMEPLLERAQS